MSIFFLQVQMTCVLTAMAAALAASIWSAAPAAAAAQTERPGVDDPIAFLLPARRTPERRIPAAPELPPGADRIQPLTIDAVIEREATAGRPRHVHQVVSRTAHRIHVHAGDSSEWLFERNPLDARRVSGFRVEHASKTIVFYDESDLRNLAAINGWADVLTWGVDQDLLAGMERTRQTRAVGGIRFVRYRARGKLAAMPDLWWNDAEALPGALTTTGPTGSVRFSVRRVRKGIAEDVLRLPGDRWPEYAQVDIADQLEGP